MPMTWAYRLNLYDNYDTEICLATFDTVGEMDDFIRTIFEDGAQGDCYYTLTDWIGVTKTARFTTYEEYWSDWVSDFYFQEEEYLQRVDRKEIERVGGSTTLN